MKASWLDRSIGFLAPQWGLRRQRARVAGALLARHYEAAQEGRRTQGWRRSSADANATNGPALSRLRDHARDLVRNNPYAKSARETIADHVVGWGITAGEDHEVWKKWTEGTGIDVDGRNNLAGLQKLVVRTVVESGECLVRRIWRPVEWGLPLPLQLQVLEPDYLDTLKDLVLGNGNRVIHGVEYDRDLRRVAYWLYDEHPGSVFLGRAGSFVSRRVPSSEVLHVFHVERAGQVRGPSWFSPVILKLKDFDEYDDATLVKQKVAACLSVLTSDADGTAPPLGTADPQKPEIDQLEPGLILNVPPGRTVTVVDPPRVSEHRDYSAITLRAIATGLGVTYEDLTGDYTNLPFSAARMARLRHQDRVNDWRWLMLIPQFCDPVWSWAMQAAAIMGLPVVDSTDWTAPQLPAIEPDKEARGHQASIRSGLTSLSEVIREKGYKPRELLTELAKDFALLDELGLVLDCDPRKVSQAGLTQGRPQGTTLPDTTGEPAPEKEPAAAPAQPGGDGGGDDEEDEEE